MAKFFKEYVKLIPAAPEATLIDIFKIFLSDESEHVRAYAIESLIPFYQVSESQNELTGYMEKLLADANWRVKASFIDNFADLSKNLPKGTIDSKIIPLIQKTLQENESEFKNRFL